MFRALRVTLYLLVFGLFTLSLQATSVVLHFDENGNGASGTNGGPLTPDPGIMAIDPHTGNFALLYLLPAGVFVFSGDVTVTDPDGGVSELLRFTDPNGGETRNQDATQMFYYSDNLAGRIPWPTSGSRE